MEHIYRSRRERLQYIVPEEGREEPRHIIIALIYERSEKEKRERERECELPPLTQISRDGGEVRNSASRLKGNGELVARNFSRSVLQCEKEKGGGGYGEGEQGSKRKVLLPQEEERGKKSSCQAREGLAAAQEEKEATCREGPEGGRNNSRKTVMGLCKEVRTRTGSVSVGGAGRQTGAPQRGPLFYFPFFPRRKKKKEKLF